mgnify:CR=1 FL=1
MGYGLWVMGYGLWVMGYRKSFSVYHFAFSISYHYHCLLSKVIDDEFLYMLILTRSHNKHIHAGLEGGDVKGCRSIVSLKGSAEGQSPGQIIETDFARDSGLIHMDCEFLMGRIG